MTQVDDYKSPWKDKDAKMVNDTAYTFLNSYDDEISDLDKIVEASKEPIKDTHVHTTSVGTTSANSVVTEVGIIGRGRPRAISGGSTTQGMIHGGTSIISSNVITHVLTDSSKMIIKSDSFTLHHLKSKTLMIASQPESFLTYDRDVRASSEIGDSRPDHGRIGTPFVNKEIWRFMFTNESINFTKVKVSLMSFRISKASFLFDIFRLYIRFCSPFIFLLFDIIALAK